MDNTKFRVIHRSQRGDITTAHILVVPMWRERVDVNIVCHIVEGREAGGGVFVPKLPPLRDHPYSNYINIRH